MDARPDPQELLKKITHEHHDETRGKLKIFFGYVAGVGKTYAMLEAAHALKEMGVDVVAGYVEPHQRPATARLLEGLEVLPTLDIKHKGITLHEFDLDGALQRKPDLILVDELAHTNDEACRHAKRYQDIYELLAHGIDVYTTVNVQHIESLNDIIASITSVVVKERIPDHVFDDATQVELVDIEPQDLIERLQEGKIYQENQAKRALSNFFMLDNLIALREIALRRSADRVNKNLEKVKIKKENGGFTNEHILVCLSPAPSNQKVIRTAARMASAFFAEFTAVFVETPDMEEMSDKAKESLRINTKLARQLGAKIVNLYGEDIPTQIGEYASFSGISKIVLGRTSSKKRLLARRHSFVDKITQIAPSIDVYIIPDTVVDTYKPSKGTHKKRISFSFRDTSIALSVLILVNLVGIWFRDVGFSEANIIMLHILGVLITSLLTENLIYTLIASLLSVLSFNFFFTVPMHSFMAYDKGYPITFVIMFLTAFITGTLTKRVKEQARISTLKAYRMEILLQTSQKLQLATTESEIIEETAKQLLKLVNKTILFYPIGNNGLEKPIVFKNDTTQPETEYLNKDEEAVASWVYKNNKHAGASTSTLPGATCLYLAVRSKERVFAVLGIYLEGSVIESFENNLLMAMLSECALALEKEKSHREKQVVELKANQEELRANLLRSISHDLRTPLTSISGNAGVLIGNADKMDTEHKLAIYQDIYEDSMWLINLVENLLSVTRIENGSMQIHLELELINEVILEAMHHISKEEKMHHVQVHLEDDFLFAEVDTHLIMQVIINIVNNAIKYTPVGSYIDIVATKVNNEVVIEIKDDGEGIPDDIKDRLFEMFFTRKNDKGDSRRGLGLGLALCKSIIEAHGGQISIMDNVPHGSIFVIRIPAKEVDIHE